MQSKIVDLKSYPVDSTYTNYQIINIHLNLGFKCSIFVTGILLCDEGGKMDISVVGDDVCGTSCSRRRIGFPNETHSTDFRCHASIAVTSVMLRAIILYEYILQKQTKHDVNIISAK